MGMKILVQSCELHLVEYVSPELYCAIQETKPILIDPLSKVHAHRVWWYDSLVNQDKNIYATKSTCTYSVRLPQVCLYSLVE